MKKILVYDDDEDILEVVAALFKMYDYSAIFRTECISVVEEVSVLKPDLILMDIRMPGMSGECAAKLLKENECTRPIPVVLFSAVYDLEKLASETSCDGFIKKPFNVDDLVKIIEEKTKNSAENIK